MIMEAGFNYISSVLEEEFEMLYWEYREAGVLQFELINMLTYCQPVFDELKFSEENENRFLRYAIIGTVGDYLDNSERENVSYGLQQPGKISR